MQVIGLLSSVGGGLWIEPLFAQAAAEGEGGGSFMGLMPALALSLLFFYFLMIRPEKKRERELQAKLAELKKNDRVLTHSGIYGVVTNVKREADEVTLKVDEETNTKLRVTLRSIAKIITDNDSAISEKPKA